MKRSFIWGVGSGAIAFKFAAFVLAQETMKRRFVGCKGGTRFSFKFAGYLLAQRTAYY